MRNALLCSCFEYCHVHCDCVERNKFLLLLLLLVRCCPLANIIILCGCQNSPITLSAFLTLWETNALLGCGITTASGAVMRYPTPPNWNHIFIEWCPCVYFAFWFPLHIGLYTHIMKHGRPQTWPQGASAVPAPCLMQNLLSMLCFIRTSYHTSRENYIKGKSTKGVRFIGFLSPISISEFPRWIWF